MNNIEQLIDRSAGSEWSSPWESDLYDFVRHWTNTSDSIEVKTSGSTGLPKIIRHTKEAMRQSAVRTNDFLQLQPGMNALLCMSTRNIAGMMMVVRAFERNLNLLPVAPDGHPLKGIPTGTSIDFCAMVPAQVYNSLQVPEERRVLKSIRHLIIGGAPVSYALNQRLKELPGSVWATFGMTETISHIALRKLNGEDASNEYTLLEGVAMETGTSAVVGAIGNLIIHAPYLSPEAIITNDVVELTSPRTFRWLGRQDHVIISGGFKIFPEVVEEKIAGVLSKLSGEAEHAGEAEYAGQADQPGHAGQADHSTQRYFIASVPDDKLGEKPILIIEAPEPAATEKEVFIHRLTEQLRTILPKHEVPREIRFMEKFIETPTGKIIRSMNR